MAATLDDLMKIDGVTIAFEYVPDGTCVAYRGKDISPEMAAMVTHYCALVTMMFKTLSSSFANFSEQNWIPPMDWSYTGGDYTVLIGAGGYRGVFIEKDKADLSELLAKLSA